MKTILVLLAALFLSNISEAFAADPSPQNAAIKTFLDSKATNEPGAEETAEAQGSVLADLNGDGKEDIVLVWTTMGPTYSHSTLTILLQSSKDYKEAASYDLDGEAKAPTVKDGIITIDQTLYAKTDPICCPSIPKQMHYSFKDGKLSALSK